MENAIGTQTKHASYGRTMGNIATTFANICYWTTKETIALLSIPIIFVVGFSVGDLHTRTLTLQGASVIRTSLLETSTPLPLGIELTDLRIDTP